MVDQVQPLKQLNDLEQAALYHSRERRRSLTGDYKLSRTHVFANPSTPIDLGASFPDRALAITVATKINITAASPIGNVFQIGTAANSIAVYLNTNEIGFLVGGGGGVNEGHIVLGGAPAGRLVADEALYDLAVAVIPGLGLIGIYINGNLVAKGAVSSGTTPSGLFSNDDTGSFGAAMTIGVNTIIPAGARVTPTNFNVVKPLSIFLGQFPRGLLA